MAEYQLFESEIVEQYQATISIIDYQRTATPPSRIVDSEPRISLSELF